MLRLNAFLKVLTVALMVGMTIAIAAATFGLLHLRVGGPIANRQAAAFDLVADILPPPAYLVESMLVVEQGSQDPSAAEATLAKLAALRADYETRIAYWRKSEIPEDAKASLARLDEHGRAFWRELDQTYAPALKSGDVIAVNMAAAKLDGHYRRHRVGVDELTAKARSMVADAANESHSASLTVFAGLGVVAIAMLGMILLGVGALRKRIIDPLARMTAYMGRLAEGDYSQEPPMRERKDEVGDMAAAVSVFRAAAIERRQAVQQEKDREAAAREEAFAAAEAEARGRRSFVVDALDEGLRRLAQGDLSQRIDAAFPEEFERLRRNFNDSIVTLRDTIHQVVSSAGAVGGGARQITVAADDLARRTEQQAAGLEQTAAALDEVTATIKTTAINARTAYNEVALSRDLIGASSAVASEAGVAMERIDTSSRKIGQIITVVDEIAFQTNLLALNAGVEAARAGEAGRGFAVVAMEVRALAQRSADAAKEIKTLVEEASRSVENGVELVGRVGDELTGVVAQFGKIQTLVEGIAQAAHDQATGLGEVNSAVSQMDQVTQQNAAMVEETTAASHSLTSEARQLAQLMERFQTEGGATVLAA
ncbi:methyl-accepting chemotaxis protein [Caulobacter vibrioides]|uniref:Methyl-accepting chemotaxis protein n=1 Tax=Caulobacter vibrioides TaxID=155892 RepID=A0A290N2T3_CAUVI|nr:methyl-accepting chemotaxis protein [Caulobacter vibrioides]ATC33983.1 methyl-accepting chemotaxis protein [Caulobacter vibrioides]